MINYITIPISEVRIKKVLVILSLGLLWYCHNSLAAREAIVTTPKAIIYSSTDLEAPIGYVSRGKKVKVGEVLKGKAGFYPIVVSNRIAYIRARDIDFNVDEKQAVATRFYELTKENLHKSVSVGFTNYSTSTQSDTDAGSFDWLGYQIKGEVINKNNWGLQILTGGLWATKGEEQFRMIELGVGASYTLFHFGPFRTNLFGQLIGVPFANYSLGSKFRINGGGFGFGGGVSASMDIAKRWGVEGSLGIYRTKLMGFDAPEGYEAPDPTFSGSRLVLSAYYRFE